jgi:polyhydroxyalkanoate synthase
LRHGGLADVTPLPTDVIDEGPQRTVRRYRLTGKPGGRKVRQPVLLVPPLASPPFVFDMRRGCSMAEFLLEREHAVYLVEYGQITFAQRGLGLEHWVDGVLPQAIRAVSQDNAGRPVHVVGWCLGGTLAALAAADDPALPIASIAMIASPVDATRVPLATPIRALYDLTGGFFVTTAYRALGIAPGPVVKRAFQLATFDRYLTRPLRMLQNIEDRDYLEQVETLNRLMDNMIAYPGRTLGQLYHDIFRANKLATGRIELGEHEIDLHVIDKPLLSIAGADDGIAPAAAVHHIKQILPHAQVKTAPGGHVGVIAGTTAADTTWSMIDDFINRQAGRSSRAGRPARARGTQGARQRS